MLLGLQDLHNRFATSTCSMKISMKVTPLLILLITNLEPSSLLPGVEESEGLLGLERHVEEINGTVYYLQ